MSQSRQSNSTATARVGTSPDADTLVEAYAEDLMDDIFEDVDRILAGDDAAVYAETTEQMVSDSPLFKSEAVTVPAMIVPFAAGQTMEAPAATPLADFETEPQADEPPVSPDQPAKQRTWRNILLGAAGLSFLAACGFWWMRQQPASQTVIVPATDATPAVSSETAFGDYLQRSLQVIRGERSAQTDAQPPGGVASPPPAAPAANQPNSQPGGVIERVFVPLLQPGSATNPRPNQTTAPNTTATLPAPNLPTTQPSSANEASSPDSTTTGSIPNIATAGSYELVGVLELGKRSAALFEVDGTSQRVYIGETIGASGWSIVSIGDEEVVVRRNGEVRSIYIGQQF